MVKYIPIGSDRMNKTEKNELRNIIEEKLNRIKKGKKISIEKNILEYLLFEEYNVTKPSSLYNKKTIKYLYWTGNFLKKIDLRGISFEGICINRIILSDLTGIDEEKIPKIEINNTNAIIDIDKVLFPNIVDECNLEGTKIKGIIKVSYQSNMKRCNLTKNNFDKNFKAMYSNFENNNLTGLIINNSNMLRNADFSFDPLSCNNYKKTNITIEEKIYNEQIEKIEKYYQKSKNDKLYKYALSCLEGCNIIKRKTTEKYFISEDRKLIEPSSEEIKKLIKKIDNRIKRTNE